MPSLLPKYSGDPAITISRMLVAEFDHPLHETLFPQRLLLGTIPVA
jgi:hypothetical protein